MSLNNNYQCFRSVGKFFVFFVFLLRTVCVLNSLLPSICTARIVDSHSATVNSLGVLFATLDRSLLCFFFSFTHKKVDAIMLVAMLSSIYPAATNLPRNSRLDLFMFNAQCKEGGRNQILPPSCCYLR